MSVAPLNFYPITFDYCKDRRFSHHQKHSWDAAILLSPPSHPRTYPALRLHLWSVDKKVIRLERFYGPHQRHSHHSVCVSSSVSTTPHGVHHAERSGWWTVGNPSVPFQPAFMSPFSQYRVPRSCMGLFIITSTARIFQQRRSIRGNGIGSIYRLSAMGGRQRLRFNDWNRLVRDPPRRFPLLNMNNASFVSVSPAVENTGADFLRMVPSCLPRTRDTQILIWIV